jgi:translation initiation factor 2 subunit 1
MLYTKQGWPEEDDIVLCKVTKIFPSSVFVDLLEYERQSGMIHISEISPGRIRNLRDYVSEGREIVCKILRIDREKGHIDLSLRRVSTNQRRAKLEEIKQETKAENLVKQIAKNLGMPLQKLYETLTKEVFKEYSHLYLCFRDIAAGNADLKKMGVNPQIAEEVTRAVLEKFKPEKITISGIITLETYAGKGVERIQRVLQDIMRSSDTIKVFYLGAGRYQLSIEDFDYKPAEKTLKNVLGILETFNDKISTASFERK